MRRRFDEDVREAGDAVGRLVRSEGGDAAAKWTIGVQLPDDLLGEIFARFCIGK